MGSARAAGYVAIIFCLVGAGFSHWIWISGADPAVPGVTTYSYDFKLGPLQPEVEFVKCVGLCEVSGVEKTKKESRVVRSAKAVADMGGQAVIGKLSGSRASMWADVINGVASYSELHKKVCGGGMSALLSRITTTSTHFDGGENDCGSIQMLQWLSIGSMLWLNIGILFAVLGLVQHFTGKIVSYAWENVFAFLVAASCAVVMFMQSFAAMLATGLMYEDRWFKFVPYFGVFWHSVAIVLSFVIVTPCCNDRQASLLKDDAVHEARPQGGQYGAYGQQQ